MNDDATVAVGRGRAPSPAAGRFDRVSVALHWLTVGLVIVQLATAFVPRFGQGDAAALLALHRSTGVLTLLTVAGRLAWRRWFAEAPPLPPGMPKAQQFAAKANAYGLYALLLVQPLTGLADAISHGRPFPLFGVQVPALMARHKALSHLAAGAHELGAWALLALIGLHIGAAALHGLVLRDGVLQRMLPARR